MTTQSMLKSVDSDLSESPLPKRARYDCSAETERWTLSKNDIVLHSVYDAGLGHLDVPDCDLQAALKNEYAFKKSTETTTATNNKLEQIAVLEASLPEHTLQKLSLGELKSITLNQQKKSEKSDINYFDLLPDEIILQIFQRLSKSQLCNISLVCRRFNQLAQDESLWTKMDVAQRILEPGSVGKILSRQVIILRLARSIIMSPIILPTVKAALPDFRCRLMYLDLTMAHISPESLTIMFIKCKRLRKLSLESVPVNDHVLIALSGNRDLEVLNLAMATGIGVEGLKSLLTSCRKLKELNLSWTYLNCNSIDFVCENLPPSLDRFNFSGCRKLLNDQNVIQLVANCPNLRELDLSDCTSITGEAVKTITILEELNFLSLSRCYFIPFRSLLYLKNMKSLAYLDIHGNYLNPTEFKVIEEALGASVKLNKFIFSSIARPTVGLKKSTIWNMRVRD